MLLKIIVILLLAVIVYCLGSGVYYLVRSGDNSQSLVKALTWRVALSLGLFAFLMIAYYFGWITPHAQILLPQ